MNLKLYTHANLHTSKSVQFPYGMFGSFTPMQIYILLKDPTLAKGLILSFTPMQIYILLKDPTLAKGLILSFTPMQIYILLKA